MKIFPLSKIPRRFSAYARGGSLDAATYVDDSGVLRTQESQFAPRYQDGVMLLEAASTNTARYSSDFSKTSDWTFSNSTRVAGVTAPDGSSTATTWTEASDTASQHTISLLRQTVVAGETYCMALHVKAGAGTRYLRLQPGGATYYGLNLAFAVFDVATGAVLSQAASVVSAGSKALGDGWFRCWVSAVAIASGSNVNVGAVAGLTQSGSILSYNGDGTSSLQIWGVDYTAGAQPSSHIPTNGAAVTRAAEQLIADFAGAEYETGSGGSTTGYLYTNGVQSAPAFVAGTTYATGARVYETAQIYARTAAPLVGSASDPFATQLANGNFVRVGPDNRLAAFDGELNTRSYRSVTPGAQAGMLHFLVSLEGADAVYVGDITGAARLRVRVRDGLMGAIVSDVTIDQALGQRVPSQYLLTGLVCPNGGVLEVSVTGPVAPGIGLIAWGQAETMGCTRYGVRSGIRDYSRKEADDFGQVVFVRRAFSKTVSASVEVEKADINRVSDRLYDLRATPLVWIFSEESDYATPLAVFGFYRDFYSTIETPTLAVYSVEVEGLA